MAINETHLNDTGVQFKITISDGSAAKDVSYAITKEIIFRKPSGSILTKTAVFDSDGTDGIIKYTSVAGDLDEVGIWKLQARIASTGNDKKTDVATFKVVENLE